MARFLLGLFFLVGGCLKSNAVDCVDYLCPDQSVCDLIHKLCVTPDQLTECNGLVDKAACPLPNGLGACHDNVCLPASCGNGRVDLVEACDDGNTTDGDGCSSNCNSDETCGNGTQDLAAGEACDDGNHIDHDGCTSACQLEQLAWVELADPVARWGMQAAYDVARDTIVMFGGRVAGTTTYSTETSEWRGVWRPNIAAIPPPAVYDFAMAYDSDRKRVVLCGGQESGPANGVWEWDGVRWTRVGDGPAVYGHAMTYDAKRRRIVVFGGNDSTGATADTWEWDGTTWSKVTTVNKPPARENASMSYDPKRGVAVLFGGFSGAALRDTWEYNGTDWTNRTPAALMPYLSHAALAYSTAVQRTVLFGGFDASSNGSAATYTWDGTQWTIVAGANPPARGAHIMVEDGHGRLLVFGGRPNGTLANILADTWIFDGMAWSEVTAATKAPATRIGPAMATELDQGKVVLFGGRLASNNSMSTETWELTARGWTLFPDGPFVNDSPPPTDFPGTVYDSKHGQLVLFGGQKPGPIYDDTTWLRTGSSWAPVHPTPSPSGRVFHSMAYDAGHGVTVLFGGIVTGTPSAETWLWDGNAWTLANPMHSPPPRAGAAMAYDWKTNVVVLVGQNLTSNASDVWIWDGADWHDATPSSGDRPGIYLYAPSLAWDPARRSLVLAGGLLSLTDTSFDTFEWSGAATSPVTGSWNRIGAIERPGVRAYQGAFTSLDGSGIGIMGGQLLVAGAGDVWMLRDDGPRSSDACVQPIDVDGDALTACADPDCWRVCAPDCPPGTSCPPTAPHCGDGICSAIESCHTCPQDCASCAVVCGDFICDPGESCPGDCP